MKILCKTVSLILLILNTLRLGALGVAEWQFSGASRLPAPDEVAGIPAAWISSQVLPVATILNPSSRKLLATSTTSALSLRLTEMSTVPSSGSLFCVAS